MGDYLARFCPHAGSGKLVYILSMQSLYAIPAFLPLTDTLATSGQPSEAQFAAVREAGFTTVINLALPQSSDALPDEAATVRGLGMKYIAIPVVWEAPTVEDAHQFFAEMDALDARPDEKTLIHCVKNMRVSAFVYLWRITRKNWSHEDAARDLHRIWKPDGRWAQCIEHVAPHVNTLPSV